MKHVKLLHLACLLRIDVVANYKRNNREKTNEDVRIIVLPLRGGIDILEHKAKLLSVLGRGQMLNKEQNDENDGCGPPTRADSHRQPYVVDFCKDGRI